MSRHAKLAIATLATALMATLGTTVGVSSAGPAIDKAPSDHGKTYKDASWCC